MTKFSKISSFLLASTLCLNMMAQSNGSSSSYSRFGLGTPEVQAQGFNKAMAGTGLGYRAGGRINTINPASYSAIDSTTLLLDVGMTAAFGNMKQNGNKINIYQCKLDFVNVGLRLYRNLGLSAGFMPYTTIGYDFRTSSRVAKDPSSLQTITSTTYYSGEGGLHQAYLGLGYKVFKELSLGVNASFIWGDYTHAVIQTYSTGDGSTSYNGLNSLEGAEIRTWKLDIGTQYPIRLTPTDVLTIGATASIGHKIKSDANLIRYTDEQDDETADTIHNAFDLPYTYGIGATWRHKGNLVVGMDFKHEFWASCRTPQIINVGSVPTFVSQTGGYNNRFRISLGAEYIPDPVASYYAKRVQYRIGASYTNPYLKVNGIDGPKEYSITAGIGLPIPFSRALSPNNRSVLNLGLEWLRRTPSNPSHVTENYVMLNVGVTINEAWFMKYKIH